MGFASRLLVHALLLLAATTLAAAEAGFVLLPLERRPGSLAPRLGRRLASPAFAPSQLHRPELESYLSTTVAIGSPPRLFEVIVDTGSSLAYVPCSSCKTCGSHMGGSKFAPRKSKTAKSLKCKRHKDCGCDSIDCQCIHNQCYYEIRYAEGSSSRGKLMSDHVRLGSVESRNASVLTGRASFGCATFESGLIRTQKADWILGLSRSKLALLNQMKRGGREASSFGICAAQKTGIFALGRVDPALLVKKCKGPEARMRLIHNRRTRRKHLFAVGLRGAHLGGQGETRGAERRAMVIDTGSTLSYFPKRLFEDLTRQLERVPGTRRVPVRGVQGGHCFSGAEEGGWARWPDLRLVLGNATLAIPPRNYLSRAKQGSEVYCPLFAQSKGHEIHLGSVMLEGFMVEFSARELTIWSKCNCSL